LERWDDVKNQHLYVPGLLTTANDILDAFQSTPGDNGQTKQQWEANHVDVKESRREAEARMERGFPDAAMFLMERAVLFDKEVGAVKPFAEKDGKEKLGLHAEELNGLVKEVIHEIKHHGSGGCGCD
jgi:hypothetical protein